MISSLRIERFKCFEDVNITFGKITLFAGINGTGKSTVIQALLLLRQAYITGALKDNKLPLYGDIVKIGTVKDALYYGSDEDSVAFTANFGENPEALFRWIFEYENLDNYFMEGTSSNMDLPSSGIFAPRFFCLTAERLGPRLTYPMTELSKKEMHVGFQGEYTAHCLAKFGDDRIPNSNLALKTDEGVINSTLAHQTQLWMRQVTPYVMFNTESVTQTDWVKLGIKVYGGQTDYMRPTNLGFGISYTLPIIVAALMAEPETMLIIENPEAHLHPAGQSRLAQFLAKIAENGVQVVLETHSDHILNGLRIAVKKEIISNPEDMKMQFFSRGRALGSNIVKKPRIFKDGGIDCWPEGFFDQFEQDLEELF
ncbi:DUF3696 domain-containing protein [Desulfococcaceae bacterium HSG8]|nr:DUF3696 domain-containing protein [Desulfococcaceae bacterium HSG8]